MIIRTQNAALAEVYASPIFTGEVRRQELVGDDDAPSQRVTAITFVDGARNAWHAHSVEQVLVITHGTGIVANSEEERQVSAGDVVLIQPGERHWHGAAPGEDMTHLAILLPSEMTVFED